MLPDPLFGVVYMYGLMIGVGILAAFAVLYLYGKKMQYDVGFLDFLFYNAIASIAVGFGAAATFQSIYNYIDAPARGFTSETGVIVGSIVGGLLFFGVMCLVGKRLALNLKGWIFWTADAVGAVAVGFSLITVLQSVVDFARDPSGGLALGSGITFIGGFIGGALFFLAMYFMLRPKLSMHLSNVISLIPCAITVGHAFGRVGCFFAGCCYGRETDSIFGVQFPHLATRVHPTQLYEAIFLFVLFGVCSFLLLKFRFKHNLSVYFVGYGVFRFFNEYLRDDDRGALVGGLSPSQFWSLVMILIGVAVAVIWEVIDRKRKARTGE